MPRRPPAPLRRGTLAILLAVLMVAEATVAAETRHSPLPEASAPFGPAGWALVVGVGFLAVAAGALTIGRAHRPQPRPRATEDPRAGMPGGEAVEDSAHATPAAEESTAAVIATASSDRSGATPAAAERVGATQPRIAAAANASPLAASDVATDAPAAAPAAPGTQALLALRHVDLSIEVLRRQLDRESRPMPAVWVMLLDLCRTHGREQRFRELALEFHQRFNVRTPKWERYPPNRAEPGLESYPRLIREITAAWGTHECRRLLDRLLYDNRSSARRGFALNAYNDLIALRRAAGAVMESIDADVALAAKRRDAATAPAADASVVPARAGDVAAPDAETSPSEPKQTGLGDALELEWGEAALAGRICEMLARGADTPAPSAQATEQRELLKQMARRVGGPDDLALAANG